jgi:hypothetical protein
MTDNESKPSTEVPIKRDDDAGAGQPSERPTILGGPGFDRPTLIGDTAELAASERSIAAIKIVDLTPVEIGSEAVVAVPDAPTSAAKPAIAPPSAPQTSATQSTGMPTELLVLVERHSRVLIGLKSDETQGIGATFRATVRAGEPLRDAALRVVHEASGLDARDARLHLVANTGDHVLIGMIVTSPSGEPQINPGWQKWAWVAPANPPVPLEHSTAKLVASFRTGMTFLDLAKAGGSGAEATELAGVASTRFDPDAPRPDLVESVVTKPAKHIVLESLIAGVMGAGGVLLTLGLIVQGVDEARVWNHNDISDVTAFGLLGLSWPLATYFGFETNAPTWKTLAVRAALTLIFGGFVAFCVGGFLAGVVDLRRGSLTLAFAVLGLGGILLMRFLGGRPRSKEMPVRLAFASLWFTVAFVAMFVFSSTFRGWVESPSRSAHHRRY